MADSAQDLTQVYCVVAAEEAGRDRERILFNVK